MSDKENKSRKKTIPKAVKDTVWSIYIGADKAEGKCYVCGRTIHISDFDLGHNKARIKGGGDSISNLRPICRTCNTSMGATSIEIFKAKYFDKVKDTSQLETNWIMQYYVQNGCLPTLPDYLLPIAQNYVPGKPVTKDIKLIPMSGQFWARLLPSEKDKLVEFVEWLGNDPRDYIEQMRLMLPPSSPRLPIRWKR